jgi:hypothetical protein
MALQLLAVGERTRWVSVDWRASRLGGVLAVVGALTLLITTQSWVAVHLGQLRGIFGIAGGLLVLSLELFRRCRAGPWAVLGAGNGSCTAAEL